MAETTERAAPLAYGSDGAPIPLDPRASCWRVLWRRNGPRVAVQHRDGGALYVDLSTTGPELRKQTGGGGSFQLMQCDDTHEACEDAALAVVDLADAPPAPDVPILSPEAAALAEQRAMIDVLKTMCRDAVEANTKMVCALAGAGLKPKASTEQIATSPTAPPAHEGPSAGEALLKIAQDNLPAVLSFVQAKWGAPPTPATPGATPPNGAPAS